MIRSASLQLSAFKSIDCFKLMKVLLSKRAFIVRPWQVQHLPFTLPKWACLERGSLLEFSHGQSLGGGRRMTMRINKNQCPSHSARGAHFFSSPAPSVHSCLAFWTCTESDCKCGGVPPPDTPPLRIALCRPDLVQLNSNWISGFQLAAHSNCN